MLGILGLKYNTCHKNFLYNCECMIVVVISLIQMDSFKVASASKITFQS